MTIRPYHAEWLARAQPGTADHYTGDYPVALKDGSILRLPLRELPGGDKAIALLMANQTSFAVEREITTQLTELAREIAPDAIVGIPTMGMVYAKPVAENIGHAHYVALGLSRKFWYDEELSEPMTSSTSPNQSKRLYLDPALLGRVRNRRVVIIDDVLNTGKTICAAIRLLQKAGARIEAIIAPLSEGWDWCAELGRIDPELPARVHVLGHIPLFVASPVGWTPMAGTRSTDRP